MARRDAETLELHEPEGAYRRIEEWLRARGFFAPGGEDLVADLFLGYGLSQAIRRRRDTAADRAVRAPARCVQARRATRSTSPRRQEPLAIGAVGRRRGPRPNTPTAIELVRDAIARGDVYQVNLVQHLSAACPGDPARVARALAAALSTLRPLQPRPFVGDGWAVVSASPELFLARRGERVWTMPIKGTRPLGGAVDLAESEKDAAEHVMIVDLERNDLSRICRAGTVRWPELMDDARADRCRAHGLDGRGDAQGRCRARRAAGGDVPGGSVTGAPKIAAVDLIAELEPVGRGASMGALGRVYGNGDLDLALTIRTFAVADDRVHLWVGGGVVWDSDPVAEVEESWIKARPLLDAIASRKPVEVAG